MIFHASASSVDVTRRKQRRIARYIRRSARLIRLYDRVADFVIWARWEPSQTAFYLVIRVPPGPGHAEDARSDFFGAFFRPLVCVTSWFFPLTYRFLKDTVSGAFSALFVRGLQNRLRTRKAIPSAISYPATCFVSPRQGPADAS